MVGMDNVNTSAYTSPKASNKVSTKASISQLRDIMQRLRDPQTGCAWDLKQSFATIAPFTLEEAYEVVDAIERGDWDDLQSLIILTLMML